MSGKEVAAKLREALAKMNDTGAHWYQGDYVDWDDEIGPRYCSLGAINLVTTGEPEGIVDRYSSRDEVAKLLANHLPADCRTQDAITDIVEWNDNSEREWADIVEVFTNAANAAETLAV